MKSSAKQTLELRSILEGRSIYFAAEIEKENIEVSNITDIRLFELSSKKS